MAQPKPVKPTAHRGTVDVDIAIAFQPQTQFIQRQIAVLGQPPANPIFQPAELANMPQITLALRR